MAQQKEFANTALTTCLTTELNSLADASNVISTTVLDNTGGLDFFCSLEYLVKYTSSAPAAGVSIADIYLVPALDGTNYAEGSTTITPQGLLFVGSFESRNGSTSAFERL